MELLKKRILAGAEALLPELVRLIYICTLNFRMPNMRPQLL